MAMGQMKATGGSRRTRRRSQGLVGDTGDHTEGAEIRRGRGAPNGAAGPRREWDRVARPYGECRRVAQQLGGRGYCAATKRSLKTLKNSTERHKNALTQKSHFGTLWSLKPE
eukprot:Gb_27458 [translate_table: standard]